MTSGTGEQLPSLDELLRRPSWMELAACAGMPVEVFFPVRGATATAARAVCSSCPVRVECLEDALRHEDLGVWGGTTERDNAMLDRWRDYNVTTTPGLT